MMFSEPLVSVSAMLIYTRQKNIAQVFILERYFVLRQFCAIFRAKQAKMPKDGTWISTSYRKMVEWYKIPLSPQSPVSRKIYRTFLFHLQGVEVFIYLGSTDETYLFYILSIISYKSYVMIIPCRYSILTLLDKRKWSNQSYWSRGWNWLHHGIAPWLGTRTR